MQSRHVVLFSWRLDDWQREIADRTLGSVAGLLFSIDRNDLASKICEADILVSNFVEAEVLSKARRLKFIQTTSAGVDRFDFEMLKKKGIMLASAKGCNAVTVAEHAFALMICLAHKITFMDRKLKEGVWLPWTDDTMLIDLEGKVLGIIGYGNIGRELARRAKAFGMKVYGVKRHPVEHDEFADKIYGSKGLELVLRESDFVVVTLPLTEETRGLIDEDKLRLMKKTAFIINVGRGPVIDEEALYKALTEGWIAGAGLDVWWAYPPSEEAPSRLGIHKLSNVIAIPHKGGWSMVARERCFRFAVENVRRFILGLEVRNVVNLDLKY